MPKSSNLDVERILAMDTEEFQKLNTQQLRQATQILASAANKRITRMEKAGRQSPALKQLYDSGEGKITTKDKDFNALRTEFVRARNFMTSKTSSLTGWNASLTQTQKTLKSKYNIDVDRGNLEMTLRSYSELKNIDPSVQSRILKYKVIEMIDDLVSKTDGQMSPGEIAQIISRQVNAIYEEQQGYLSNAGVSEFFDIEDDL